MEEDEVAGVPKAIGAQEAGVGLGAGQEEVVEEDAVGEAAIPWAVLLSRESILACTFSSCFSRAAQRLPLPLILPTS